MIHAQNTKIQQIILPQELSTNAITGSVDSLGYDYLTVALLLDTQATTSNRVENFVLTEGDTSTSFASIIAFNGATATATNVGFLLQADEAHTAGDGGEQAVMYVDLKKRLRYLKVSVTLLQTSAQGAVVGTWSRPGTCPDTAAELGADAGLARG